MSWWFVLVLILHCSYSTDAWSYSLFLLCSIRLLYSVCPQLLHPTVDKDDRWVLEGLRRCKEWSPLQPTYDARNPDLPLPYRALPEWRSPPCKVIPPDSPISFASARNLIDHYLPLLNAHLHAIFLILERAFGVVNASNTKHVVDIFVQCQGAYRHTLPIRDPGSGMPRCPDAKFTLSRCRSRGLPSRRRDD